MADAARSLDPETPDPQPPFAQPDLTRLVVEHGAVLYRYAYRLTGLAADAEDLTQQVFLTALRKLNQLRDPAASRAWLCSVLRRSYLRAERKPRPQPAANFDVDVDLLAVDFPDRDEFAFDGEELQRALDELPDEFKLVLVGFYFEDCSYKELAERLALPIGTVMSRLSRAKAHLRSRLLASQSAKRRDSDHHQQPGNYSRTDDAHSDDSGSDNSGSDNSGSDSFGGDDDSLKPAPARAAERLRSEGR